MNRINEIRSILNQRGITEDVSETDVIEAIKALPRRPSLGVPAHADDTDDPSAELFTMTAEQREQLGLKTSRTPQRLRTPIRTPQPNQLLRPEDAAKLKTSELSIGSEGAGSLLSVVPVSKNDLIIEPKPRLRVRVHALVCRNDNGLYANGTQPQSKEEVGLGIAKTIAAANEIFAGTGIELIFYPSADVEIRNDTKLNQDFVIPASEQPKLTQNPPLSAQAMEDLCNKHSTTAYRDQIAAKYPGKLVLLFAEGTSYAFDATQKRWNVFSPSGGGFSWEDREFAKLSAWVGTSDADAEGYATFLSHEVGHYLHLWHTFNKVSLTAEENSNTTLTNNDKVNILAKRLQGLIQGELDKGKTLEQSIQVLDGDAAVVSDTPSDDSGEYLHYLNLTANGGNSCGILNEVKIRLKNNVVAAYKPDRSLVMSYFKGCTNFEQHFSSGQAKRMRDALINKNRRHLVKVQLGETAFPGELVSAVWNPNLNGQFFTWGNSLEDFKKKYNDMKSKGMRLHSQQAYTKNGKTVYDGIWNPGNAAEQQVIWGWTVEDFQKKDIELQSKKMRLVHLESYLMPDKQIRINAIWNQGSQQQIWVQGWAGADLDAKAKELHAKNFRIAHLNAWNLPDGQVRYDAIWNPGNHAQFYVRGFTGEDFKKKYGEMWQQNFRLLLLDAHRVGNQIRYDAVWNPSSAAQYVVFSKTREQVRADYDEMWAQGMKLISMNSVRL